MATNAKVPHPFFARSAPNEVLREPLRVVRLSASSSSERSVSESSRSGRASTWRHARRDTRVDTPVKRGAAWWDLWP